MAILPYLEAENQLAQYEKLQHELERERVTMKDVPGWKVGESVYSKRWAPPLPRDSAKLV